MKLNATQIELLVKAVMTKKLKGGNKGNRFVSESEIYKLFNKELHILEKPINVVGVESDFIEASKVSLKVKPNFCTEKELELLTTQEGFLEVSDELLSEKDIDDKQLSIYKKVFDEAFTVYGASVVSGKLIARRSGTKLLMKMELNNYFFEIELPFIDRELFCKVSGNLYSFAYMPLNLDDFIAGTSPVLKLAHPYQFLIQQAVKSVGTKTYSSDIFNFMVRKAKGGTIRQLQDNIHKTLINAKEYSWSDKNNCPVMWLDSNKSDLGKGLLANNIQLGLSYLDLLNSKGLKGVDLNTGSTSAPGKRVRVAKNYFIERKDGEFTLVRKSSADNEVFDITNDMKGELYPCFIKTSAKRDNTATIKDTYNLVNPSGYTKRFKIV